LGLKQQSGSNGMDHEIQGVYVTDVLSDALGHSKAKQVWVTIQQHLNIVAIASLKNLSAIILTKGLLPDQDTIEQSNLQNIPILVSDLESYELIGRLYNLLTNEANTGIQSR
jgi:hypothetical protein